MWFSRVLTYQDEGHDPLKHSNLLQTPRQWGVQWCELDLHRVTVRIGAAPRSAVLVPTRPGGGSRGRGRNFSWGGAEAGCCGSSVPRVPCAARRRTLGIRGEVNLPPTHSLGSGSPPGFDHLFIRSTALRPLPTPSLEPNNWGMV